jgi:hypothetical protein
VSPAPLNSSGSTAKKHVAGVCCFCAGGPPSLDDEEISTLPPFANAENRALDAAVRVSSCKFLCLLVVPGLHHLTHAPLCCSLAQVLEKELEKADAAHEENRDRINIMQEHLHNVQQELKYTQSRVRSEGGCTLCRWPQGVSMSAGSGHTSTCSGRPEAQVTCRHQLAIHAEQQEQAHVLDRSAKLQDSPSGQDYDMHWLLTFSTIYCSSIVHILSHLSIHRLRPRPRRLRLRST